MVRSWGWTDRSSRPVIDVGSQTVTEWRYVGEDDVPGELPHRSEVGGWGDELAVRQEARELERENVAMDTPFDRVVLERRTVTYGEPVRVELDEGSGDAV